MDVYNIDKSKLIASIEAHLRSEHVGRFTNNRVKKKIIDVTCDIYDCDHTCEDGGGISYTNFTVKFLVELPNGKQQWVEGWI